MLLECVLKNHERPRPHAMELCQRVGGPAVESRKMGVVGGVKTAIDLC